jgi:hypothetical protein
MKREDQVLAVEENNPIEARYPEYRPNEDVPIAKNFGTTRRISWLLFFIQRVDLSASFIVSTDATCMYTASLLRIKIKKRK